MNGQTSKHLFWSACSHHSITDPDMERQGNRASIPITPITHITTAVLPIPTESV